jgi:hypothetical protein
MGLTIALGVLLTLTAILMAVDLGLHRKFDQNAGLNYRGYRGPVLGRKAPGEIRLGLFGGSVAMGYGTKNEVGIAALLEQALNHRRSAGLRYTVANLAANNEPGIAYFKANYELFAYLDLDVLVFYVCQEEVTGLAEIPQHDYSNRSINPVMRTAGYYFIFPTVALEKYYLWRYGSVEEGYRANQRPTAEERPVPSTETLRGFLEDLSGQDKRVVIAFCPDDQPQQPAYQRAVERAAAGIPRVIIADTHGAFADGPRSSYVLADHLHYSESGNRVIAEALSRAIPQ